MPSLVTADYSSSEDEHPLPTHVLAPAVLSANPTIRSSSLTVRNPSLSEMGGIVLGPINPFKAEDSVFGKKNHLTGWSREMMISDSTFQSHHRLHQSGGLAGAPRMESSQKKRRSSSHVSRAVKKSRMNGGSTKIVDGEGSFKGPWAAYQEEDIYEHQQLASDEELEDDEHEQAAETDPPTERSAQPKATAPAESSEFVGSEQYDYQGRTYMHVPQDLDIDLHKELGSTKNYIPKKLVHTWKDPTKAKITNLRFFPNAGHLLLSGNSDGMVRLYDVYHERKLLRNYSGHRLAITDLHFTLDGSKFLTSSYDRYMKLWDTETGQVISRFSNGKIPHCTAFHPGVKQNYEFLSGMSDNKVLQWDTRSGEQTQEYDRHLQAINSLTFYDEDRRFASTSDDKVIRIWEYGIPVPIQNISDPLMFPINRAARSPNAKHIAMQSGDNQIIPYTSTSEGKLHRARKKDGFRGHNNAGYAIDLEFSPDGQFLASGDSAGFVCFWDWKTGKMWHKIKASEKGATTTLAWQPQEASKLATAGTDGTIRYWS